MFSDMTNPITWGWQTLKAMDYRGHAIFTAYLSIICGLIEVVISLIAGSMSLSMSLYGIAIMGAVDVTGSMLVLIFWQRSDSERSLTPARDEKMELRFSYAIGIMMMLLGTFLTVDSVKNLIEGASPTDDEVGSEALGPEVALFGAFTGCFLALYKYILSKKLRSPIILADSFSSFCAGLSSMAALIVHIVKFVWYLDGLTGLIVAFYTLYMGASVVMENSYMLSVLMNEGISPTYIRLVQHFRYSYRNELLGKHDSSNSSSNSSLAGGKLPSSQFDMQSPKVQFLSNSLQHTDKSILEIVKARPTPYNNDIEARSSNGFMDEDDSSLFGMLSSMFDRYFRLTDDHIVNETRRPDDNLGSYTPISTGSGGHGGNGGRRNVNMNMNMNMNSNADDDDLHSMNYGDLYGHKEVFNDAINFAM